jgi:hypothetical protein
MLAVLLHEGRTTGWKYLLASVGDALIAAAEAQLEVYACAR